MLSDGGYKNIRNKRSDGYSYITIYFCHQCRLSRDSRDESGEKGAERTGAKGRDQGRHNNDDNHQSEFERRGVRPDQRRENPEFGRKNERDLRIAKLANGNAGVAESREVEQRMASLDLSSEKESSYARANQAEKRHDGMRKSTEQNGAHNSSARNGNQLVGISYLS